jgi:endonuclease G
MNRETRYGCPSADQILENRFYTVGYSYYFRQAKWSLEIIHNANQLMNDIERLNNFRPDFRVPSRFRADLSEYRGSGYDRGHLVASANQDTKEIQNSETFLLSNMSPQKPEFNRKKWRELEAAVRTLNEQPDVLETYVISGPIFDFDKPIELIGEKDEQGCPIPIPDQFFKCVLAEYKSGKLKMWAFEMANTELSQPLEDYLVTTSYIESKSGLLLWDKLLGMDIEKEKNQTQRIWQY